MKSSVSPEFNRFLIGSYSYYVYSKFKFNPIIFFMKWFYGEIATSQAGIGPMLSRLKNLSSIILNNEKFY